jgi:paraquat-inducible protein B
VLAKISRLDVETPLQKLNQAIDEYKSLAQNINQIAATVSHQNTPEELTLALKQINKSMATFDVTMAQFEKTMDDYENGSAMYYQLEQTLLQLKKITEQLQPLTKELNEQPNMLIFDRDLNGDILPKKGTTK